MPKANAGRGAAWNSSLSNGEQRDVEPGLLMGRRRLQGEQSTVKVLLSLSRSIWTFSVQLPKTNVCLPRMGAALFLVETMSTLNPVGCGRSEHPNAHPGVSRWLKVTPKSTGAPSPRRGNRCCARSQIPACKSAQPVISVKCLGTPGYPCWINVSCYYSFLLGLLISPLLFSLGRSDLRAFGGSALPPSAHFVDFEP